nr:unnamed protein product [Callosobruchus chinensis]
MWHEGVSSRGGNEIASTLLKILNSGITEKKHLLLWSDNFAGQHKNKMVIFVLVFLVLHQVCDTTEYNFLISGHSFMSCDRDFALIEKRKRKWDYVVFPVTSHVSVCGLMTVVEESGKGVEKGANFSFVWSA